MGEQFKLKEEIGAGGYSETLFVGSYKDCMKEACRLHDTGFDDDFSIEGSFSNQRYGVRSHTLEKVECPICGKQVRVYQMEQTRDCHGIPYRMVCGACYDRIMDERGYDGEKYTEADENLDYDY